jgi:hypothetical protein
MAGAVSWNTDGYRAIIDEIRTNELDRSTIGEWCLFLGGVYYSETGESLPEYTASAEPAVIRDSIADTYPAAMVLDMMDGDEITDTDVTAADVAAAYVVMSRYYDWHPRDDED